MLLYFQTLLCLHLSYQSLTLLQPDKENAFNHLSKRLVQGSFLTAEGRGILLAEGLAKYLKLSVGDTLVLIGQGYHASTAAGKYAVQGIESLAVALRTTLGTSYEVMTWDDMMPEVKNSQRIDTTVFAMLSTCLFVIIGFGLIGTILMMALERMREFAALRAVGMQMAGVQKLIAVEALMLTGLGIILAFCIAVPFVLWMHYHPIPLTGESGHAFEAMGIDNPSLQLSIKPHLFALMSAIVFCIMMLSTLVPMLLVRRMKVSEAMK